jgi:arylsulfatase A-like enzyme
VNNIKRNFFIHLTALATTCAVMPITAAELPTVKAAPLKPSQKPNFIFIFIDDMGYGDLSCYGNTTVKTPSIDKMAADGILFSQFYVNSPVCSPSRVALQTGQYPVRWGITSYLATMEFNKKRGMKNYLDPNAPSLAKILKENGYATGHFGKWHIGGGKDLKGSPIPEDYGFDEVIVDRVFVDEKGEKVEIKNSARVKKHQKTEFYVDRALEFINKNKTKPFFVNLFPNDVHDFYKPKPGSEKKYTSVAKNLEDAKFLATLVELEQQIGRFMAELKKMNLLENTIVMFSSDNGPTDWPRYYRNGGVPPCSQGNLRGRKWSLYEGGIRVPFIVQWNGTIKPGLKDETTLACATDIFPTLCSLAGIDLPTNYKPDGVDISSAIMGQPITREKEIIWYYINTPVSGKPGHISPQWAIRSGDWKLLIEDDGTNVQLYNIKNDITEKNNVAKRYPEKAKELSMKLSNWKKTEKISGPHFLTAKKATEELEATEKRIAHREKK